MTEVNVTQSKWAAADSYDLDAFEQIEGPWPIGHPLPLPKWTNQSKKRLVIEKVFIVLPFCFKCNLYYKIIFIDLAI